MKEKNSREAILQSALELFAAKGYEATSPNEIVERVGVTKPTLYYFFGSKEGVFEAVLQRYYTQLDEQIDEVCVYNPNPANYQEDVFPVLVRVVNAYFDFAWNHRAFYLMTLAGSFAPPSSKTAELSEKYLVKQYKRLEQLFRQFAEVHNNLLGQERACSWQLLASVNAQVGFWHRGFGKVDDRTANEIVKRFMHGIFS